MGELLSVLNYANYPSRVPGDNCEIVWSPKASNFKSMSWDLAGDWY